MLKIHSFLQGAKEPVHQLTGRLRKVKSRMATISYMMAAVLFLLNPNYLNGGKSNIVESAKAETVPAAIEIEEETANEAIVLKSHFAMSNLMTRVNDTLTNNDSVIYKSNGTNLENTVNSENTDKNIKETMADSESSGADADKQADNGSAGNGKVPEEEKETSKETQNHKTTKKDTAKAEKTDKKYVIDLSSEEIKILQRIVEAEATGEDIKGKILVANVILNRVEDSSFPDTVKGVVFQKSQFSPIRDGRYYSVSISKETVTAVKRVMQGEDYSKGALYFSARSKADKNSMSWFDKNLDFLFQYGGHEFFK